VQVAGKNKDVDVLLVSYDLQLPRADRSTVAEQVSAFVRKREWNLPVVVFDLFDEGNIERVIRGESLGTVIRS